MRRRTLLAAGAAASFAASDAPAQQPGKIWRIGWLANSPLTAPDAIGIWEAFRLELQRLGWSEGRQVQFIQRFADGAPQRYPALARELIDSRVDLIVATGGITGAQAARDATTTIPVVFVFVPDPVESKLVKSLARPGGNLTGLTTMSNELIGKRMELLKDAFPHALRIAYLTTEWTAQRDEATALAAAGLGLRLLPVKVTRPEDLAGAIAGSAGADAWSVAETALLLARRADIVSLLAAQRKPAMYPVSIYVRAGGLMSYGVDFNTQSRRAAWFVDRILRGAKPGDLPVEQPTRFELVVNLTTARALGVTIPQSVLARADEVIE